MTDINVKNSKKKEYPLLEHVFSIVEESNNFKQIIDVLFKEIGDLYDFDSIILKEITEPNCLKCTYEWCRDGKNELLNVEQRFIENIQSEWSESYKNDLKIWSYYHDEHLNDNEYPALSRHELCESVIEFPLFKGDSLIGCLDLFDARHKHRIWQEDHVRDIYHFVRILTSYLMPLRELDQNENRINEISEYDNITHLPKYEIFYNEVTKFIKKVKDCRIEIFSLDISNFKYMNEKYGYITGNRLLHEVAEYIYQASNKVISCCRPFSDNFLVAIRAPEKDNFSYIKAVIEDSAQKYIEKLRESYYDTNIILNVGISILKKGDTNIEGAVANANIARKFAKEAKTSTNCRIVMYNVGMSLEVRKQTDLIASMNRAILENEFFIQLQPKCMTDTFTIIGAEALVRWKKDSSDVIFPEEFISIFEKNGCIIKLDYFVYEKVFEYIMKRTKSGKSVVPVSINVSYAHFGSLELVDYIKSLLDKYKIDPAYIEFELSEQIYITDNPNVGKTIKSLKDMGFKIFIDNFGTGYSSLNTLTKYDIDGIKLDRSFMNHTLNKKDEIIISCMVKMANKLGLEVLCEGVESEEQRIFLAESECPYMQGFCFSHAVNIEQFDYLLDNQ